MAGAMRGAGVRLWRASGAGPQGGCPKRRRPPWSTHHEHEKAGAAGLAKGALAGALAGAVSAFVQEQAMTAMQRMQQGDRHAERPAQQQGGNQPRQPGGDPKVELANRVVQRTRGHELAPRQERVAAKAVHYAMGTVSGAIYGAAAEADERATLGWGTAFGAAVWTAAPETTLPLLGLAPPLWTQDPKQQAVMLGMHALYGAVTETVRRPVRAMMG